MDDNDFIIISSDEESGINPTSENTEVLHGTKEDEVSHQAGNKNTKAEKLEVVHLLQDKPDNILSLSLSNNVKEHPNELTKKTKINTSASPVEDDLVEIVMNVKSDIKNEDTKNNNSVAVTQDHSFEKFTELVLSIEEKEEDKPRLLKKMYKYYKLADPTYTKSGDFIKLVSHAITKLNEDKLSLYFVLKEILDCLFSKRVLFDPGKSHKYNPTSAHQSTSNVESDEPTYDENSIFFDADEKNYKTVKKLARFLGVLGKKIKELEESEVDLSDEEDSNYFKMQRYRERFCQVYKKLCTYTNMPANAKRVSARRINFTGSSNAKLDKAIEVWLNKTMQFPDFASVLKFVKETNETHQLGISKEKLRSIALDVFTKIGNSLQLRRQYDLWDSFSSYLDSATDPAIEDPKLQQLLDKNFEIGAKREREIINYYAEKQVKESLEPLEVPDEEADQSPVESGDEDEKEIEQAEDIIKSKIQIVENEDSEEEASEGGHKSVNPIEESEVKASTSSHNPDCVGTSEVTREMKEIKLFNEDIIQLESAVKHSIPSRKGNNIESFENSVKGIHTPTSNPVEEKLIADRKTNAPFSDKKENFVKKNHENSSMNKISYSKRVGDITEFKSTKKSKIKHKCHTKNDSDCEVVVIASDEESDCVLEMNFTRPSRKVYQINYAFINNPFNYNRTPTSDTIFRKKRTYFRNGKTDKSQRRSSFLPFSDLTNIKTITNKYVRSRGFSDKRRTGLIRRQPLDRLRFKNFSFIFPGKMNNHCALENKSKTENVKGQSEERQMKENTVEGGNFSGGNSENGSVSGGGGGQDNNENNDKKKPSNNGKNVKDDKEKEDNEEEGEEEKEVPEIMLFRTPIPRVIPSSNGNSIPQSGRKLRTSRKRTGPSKRTGTKRLETVRLKIENGRTPNVNQPLPQREVFCKRNNKKITVEDLKRIKESVESASSQTKADVKAVSVAGKRKAGHFKTKSDEEIVKNFLQHSPPSISIISPRKFVQKRPSPSVLQAIETLSRLKGITTTVLKSSSFLKGDEDVTVIGESLGMKVSQTTKSVNAQNVETEENSTFVLPKIVTVRGNVSCFENMDSDAIQSDLLNFESQNSIRKCEDHSLSPIRMDSKGGKNRVKEKGGDNRAKEDVNSKQQSKNVEYVVLD